MTTEEKKAYNKAIREAVLIIVHHEFDESESYEDIFKNIKNELLNKLK